MLLPGLRKPLVVSCTALSQFSKKCASDHLISFLSAYLFGKGIAHFQREVAVNRDSECDSSRLTASQAREKE